MQFDRMAASRLSDSQKTKLVERFRAGETTLCLAEAFGCSSNTVSRTVKAFLSVEEYAALKVARARGQLVSNPTQCEAPHLAGSEYVSETVEVQLDQAGLSSVQHDAFDQDTGDVLEMGEDGVEQSLALDDAEDFGNDVEEDSSPEDLLGQDVGDCSLQEGFHEVAPLSSSFLIDEQKQVACEPLQPGVLPGSVYMLVDKTVELHVRPLKDFPELGYMSEVDQGRKALPLFANPRSAKRQCGRSQRVIKIPDTVVFELSTPYLLARGITRLVLEGSLISLDTPSVEAVG